LLHININGHDVHDAVVKCRVMVNNKKQKEGS